MTSTPGSSSRTVLILLGPPGSGKGTQAALLKEKLELTHIATGNLLREHIQANTPLGKQAKTFLDQGHLVPDPLILKMLAERISRPDCAKGFILDGFPRTISQAEYLQRLLQEDPHPIIVNLEIPDATIIERLSARMTCPQCNTPYHLLYCPPQQNGICDKCQTPLIQRTDDSPEVIAKRLAIYHEQTAPVVSFYKNFPTFHSMSCSSPSNAVCKAILAWITHAS